MRETPRSEAPRHRDEDYWKNYMELWFGAELVDAWSRACTLTSMESAGGPIGLEVYDTGSPERPTLVFSHGIAGYARILVPFLIPLRDLGYNLVAPDLRGYGYNDDRKGDFDWNTHVDNLGDAVRYARERFSGPVLLGGASMGGPLAYAAAARHGGVDGLICWCLWDFQDREFMTHETTTGRLTFALLPFMTALSWLVGGIRLRTTLFVSYDTLTDSPRFNDLLKQDPQAGTLITLHGAQSLVLQSTVDVPHGDWSLPTLILQPGEDRMTPARYTRRVFEKLGSANKRYVELEGCAHFPTEPRFYERWAKEVDGFLRTLDCGSAA